MKKLQLALIIYAFSHQVHADDTTSAAHLDWHEAPESNHCGGYYLAPKIDLSQSSDQVGQNQDLRIQADNGTIDENGNVNVSGNVVASQNGQTLEASQLVYSKDGGAVHVSGGVKIRQPGLLFIGDKASVEQNSQAFAVEQAQYVLHDRGARGQSSRITSEGNTLVLEGGSYTQCPPGDNSWLIRAGKISLDSEAGFGKAYHARLELGDIPVFYFPYIEFPIDDRRKTGFLWANISGSDNGGVDLALPYYLNIADNIDATITPRYLSGYGYIQQSELRYMNQYSHWTLNGAYFDNDEYFSSEGTPLKNRRWLGDIKETGHFNSQWRSHIAYTRVSDQDYFRDLGTIGLDVRRETLIEQEAGISYQDPNWLFTAETTAYQSLSPQLIAPQQMLPRLTLSYQAAPQNFALQPNLFSQYTQFEHDTLAEGQRLYTEAGSSFPMEWTAGFIRPSLKVKQLTYQLPAQNNDRHLNLSSWQSSLDTGLYFEKQSADWLMALEPRLYYLYAPAKEQNHLPNFDTSELDFSYQQLFRDTRFNGYDRISDADQLSASLSHRWISQASGNEVARVSIGQQFYFTDPVQLNPQQGLNARKHSDIAAIIEVNPSPSQRAYSEWVHNPDNNKLNQATVAWQWHNARWDVFNIAYRYKRQPNSPDIASNQVDLSGIYPISDQTAAIARWRYDFEANKSIEHLLGLEYESCCWLVRTIYQRQRETSATNNNQISANSVQYEHAIFLQLELKGLGNLAGRVSTLLEESILGFKQRESL